MKKLYITILFSLYITQSFAQTGYETYCFENETNNIQKVSGVNSIAKIKSNNGFWCVPRGTYRALAVFINIIYDQTPADTVLRYTSQLTDWMPDITSSINKYPPSYFTGIFDTEIKSTYEGNVTRLYAESSFNQLIMLCDFTVVNIKQSQITPNNPNSNFDCFKLMDSVIVYINRCGGLNTVYGHNIGSEYDKSSMSLTSFGPDGCIDNIHFLTRNTFYNYDKSKNYGSVIQGQGFSGVCPTKRLVIGSSSYGYNLGTYQCVGGGNLTVSKKSIWSHEIAHFFLGGNEFHTSGGNHTGDEITNTFIGKQWGYGLFNGGLNSCNGFERWRLGWRINTNALDTITASEINTDLKTKFQGEKTYILRDFVTYGDAIRIKLPYKDSQLASNQYIWLENHQSGKNGKLDDFNYDFAGTCRDVTKAGIYCYYQIGKDILESEIYNSVFPPNEKDNLRIISAEGNQNVNYVKQVEDCLGYCGSNNCRPQYEYNSENSLSGSNDQTEVFPVSTLSSKINYNLKMQYLGSKVKNIGEFNNLPWLGDNFDAFVPNTSGTLIDISSNPSAINTTTFYSRQYSTYYYKNGYLRDTIYFNSVTPERNTRKLYLTGLSIKMIDQDSTITGMKAYTVKVRWDDYDVKQNVNWAGDIILKEQLNLLQGKTITLEQNKTVNQIDKDPVSNFFAKTTFLTCEGGSVFNMATNSSILLKEKSSLVLNSSASLTIQDGGTITVESGSTLQLKSGSNLNILGGGKIVVKNGGYICVESGANINLQDYNSIIALEGGAIYGANPSLFTSPSCSSTITKTGSGSIVDYNQDVYIQNITLNTNRYIGGKNIYVGNHVTTSQTQGDVLINNGANVIFDCKEITFDAGFECAAGSTYEVKNH